MEEHDTGNGTLSAHAVLGKLSWALRSHSGKVREHNEDFAGAYAPTTPDDAWDRGPLFVVADGMGGHAAGEVASRLAVETLLSHWSAGAPDAPQQGMRGGIRKANTALIDAALEGVGRRGMGTTITALTLAGREALIGHVGDSRAYLVRDGACTQLTDDHSRVGELLRMRLITPEQAVDHPARSMLTRSLGGEMAVQPDVVRQSIERGDTFVLCSDGLWETVSRVEMGEVVAGIGTELATPADAADALIDLALQRGAADNVTVVVVRVSSDRPIPAAAAKRSLFRRRS